MIVYYVEYWKNEWESTPEYIGIFSTREKAVKAKDRYCKENAYINVKDVNIYEVTVDQYKELWAAATAHFFTLL